MANLLQFTNNASSQLASGIAPTDTTIVVTSGTGGEFPQVGANQYAVLAIEDTSGNIEYCWLTGISTDSLTVARGKEGTTALSFASGSRIEVRLTAGVINSLLQKTGGDTLTGTTNLSGVLALGSQGSIQGGEFTGAVRSAPGVTAGQITVQAGQPMAGNATILTSSNIVANLPAGASLALSGMVLFWSGSSDAVPAGWQVCDGTNGTPDLRDTFVFSLSVDSSYPSSNSNPDWDTSSTTLSLGSTDNFTLTTSQLPAHSHEMLAVSTPAISFTSGSAVFPVQSSTSGSYYTNNAASTPLIQSTGSGDAFAHGLSAASAASAHTHTYTPPYVGLLAIMKL